MLRVAIVEDHPLMLRIVAQEIGRALDMTVVWTSGDSGELLARVSRAVPDVLLLDLNFAGQPFDPVAAVRDLCARYPALAILVLTGNDDPVWVDELMRAGARGYILKSDDFSLRLADAVRAVAAGRVFLSPGAAEAIGGARRVYTLTARERAILRLAAEGRTNPAIAASLGIAEGTVRNHISNIYRKLGVETREAAVQAAQRLRELPAPSAHLRHELRTPLHSLLGLARLLHGRIQRNGVLTGEDAALIEQIALEAERLDGLIEGLDL